MKDINYHIDRTENLLTTVKNKLYEDIDDSENELVTYEIRETLLRVERREFRLNKLKYKLTNNFKQKDAASLKRIYKFLKRNHVETIKNT